MPTCVERPQDVGLDKLKMLMGENYRVNNAITIYEVTIGQIVQFGEDYFFQAVAPFVSNPTTYRLQLWDMGIDWNKIEDFDLFCMLITTIPPQISCILFGRFDFTRLKLMMRKDTEQHVLYDPETDTVIDNATYIVMREYIRLMLNQYPRREHIKGRSSKMIAIEQDRMKIINQKKKREANGESIDSYLYSLICTLLITPGFKYKKSELGEVNIMQFMETVKRFQIYKATESLMQGMYSGFLDTSKINTQKELNWFRDS